MSGAATLTNAVLNFAALREFARKELVELLDTIGGKKALVMDPKLAGPLGLVAERAMLKDHGVEKSFYLMPGRLDTDCKIITYLVHPKVHLMNAIADQIRLHHKEGQHKEYNIIFVPRRTTMCEKVLEEKGVLGDVRIGEYHLEWLPYDDDIISLELESSFRETQLEGDKSSLHGVAKALMVLQHVFGLIPHIRGAGPSARLVKDFLVRMRPELLVNEQSHAHVASEIDQLILVDRETDLITPMCTQLTYEGLLDEVLGIHNGFVDLDPEIVGQPKGPKKVKIVLNSNDKLYSEIRDLNFSVIGPTLNRKAKMIDEYYKKRHDAQTVTQIRDFMKGLGSYQQEHQSLRIHTNVAELILTTTRAHDFHRRLQAEQILLHGGDSAVSFEYIEDCLSRREPIMRVVRLVALYSHTTDGLKPRVLEQLKREVIQSYGYEFIGMLANLEKSGVWRKEGSKQLSFSTLRKFFSLIGEVSEANPADIGYTFSGYAPLSVRLVQAALKPGPSWIGVQGKLPQLQVFEETQQMPHATGTGSGSGIRPRKGSDTQQPAGAHGSQRNQVVLVVFIGGVTFAEISAVRFLHQVVHGHDLIVATTKLISGDSFLDDLLSPSIDELRPTRADDPRH